MAICAAALALVALSRVRRSLTVDAYLVRLLGIALVVRLVATVGMYLFLNDIYSVPYLLGERGDDIYYHRQTVNVAQAWAQSQSYSLPSRLENYVGYVYFNAVLYDLLVPSTIVARLANVFFSVVSLVYTFRLSRLLFDRPVAKWTTLLVALFPTHILFSVIQYRDVYILLFSVMVLLELLRLHRATCISSLVVIGASLVLLSTISWQVTYGLLAVSLFSVVASRASLVVSHVKANSPSRWSYAVFAVLCVTTVFFGVHLLPDQFIRVFNVETIHENSTRRLTAYGVPPGIRSFLQEWYVFPLFVFAPLVLPLPTLVFGDFPLVTILTLPGRVIWTLALPFFAYGVYLTVRRQPLRALPVYSFIIGMNVGMFFMFRLFGVRQLFILIPIYFLFAVVGWRDLSKRVPWFTLYFLGYLTVVGAYNLFRLFVV